MERYKEVGRIIGVTLAVYVVFEYLLPCVAPFVVGTIVAILLERPVSYLEKCHIKRCISATIIILTGLGIVGTVLGLLCMKLYEQAMLLIENHREVYETYREKIMEVLNDMIPSLINKSIPAMSGIIMGIGVVIITVIAAILLSSNFKHIKENVKSWPYGNEIVQIYRKTIKIGAAYVKTQFALMLITAAICGVAFYIMGNPYALLAGSVVGILDALPLFGSGVVLIPWAIFMLIKKNFVHAAIVFTTFGLCYVVRQVLEPKLMGDRLGISALEMLIALYVGLVLFGLWGFILGPAAYMLIREILLLK